MAVCAAGKRPLLTLKLADDQANHLPRTFRPSVVLYHSRRLETVQRVCTRPLHAAASNFQAPLEVAIAVPMAIQQDKKVTEREGKVVDCWTMPCSC